MAEKQARPAPEVWLSLEQTADLLGVSWETVHRWARDGDERLPAYQAWDEGNHSRVRYRFKRSDVEAYRALAPAPEVAPRPSKRRSAVAGP